MKDKFTILILDDVAENIYSLELLIEDEFDVNILTALDAKSAFSILMENDVDLILSDIQMPDIDGFQFAEYIKSIKKTKDIPIIFITGIYDKDIYQKKGYDLGAIEYISKPIDDNLFISKLKIYIELFNESKKTKKSLDRANSIIEHNVKMASLGEMIGVISHQIKQPLNVLSLYCDDIKFSYEYDELSKENIEEFSINTKQQIHHMRDTIDGFLDFFSPNKEKKKFLVSSSLEHALELLSSEISKNNVQVNKEIIDDFSLLGIEMELGQVFMNLINNSIEAFNENSLEDRKVDIKAYFKDEKNYIEIFDNAGGIKEEKLEKIFDPYYTTKATGTGVGLYMVKLVVKNSLHGNLKLENYNHGVRFILDFDANSEAEDNNEKMESLAKL